jgi:hypothetical protein
MNAAKVKASRIVQSIAYYAKCIVQDGIAKGYSEGRILADVRYVCEYSEVLNVTSHVLKIMDVGYGRATI